MDLSVERDCGVKMYVYQMVNSPVAKGAWYVVGVGWGLVVMMGVVL